jgi:transposase
MSAERRRFTGAEKLAILREHLIERLALSEVCRKHNISPTLFYQRQKKLFEEGASVFESKAENARQQEAEAKKAAAIEAKLQKKDEVLAELMGEHVALKKKLGLI